MEAPTSPIGGVALNRIARVIRPSATLFLTFAIGIIGQGATAPRAVAQSWYMDRREAPQKEKPDTTLAIDVHRLAKGVYAARVRYAWVGWFEQADGITMVDAGMDDRAAAGLEDTIRARSGNLPIKNIIFTHAHDDHILGGKRFIASGARVIAQAGVIGTIDSILGLPAAVVKDQVAVKHEHTVGKGPRAARVVFLGQRAHSAGDLIVYLPKEKVIFAGDLVSNRSVPWMLDRDMDVGGWLAALDTLLTNHFPADSLVPGHGQIAARSVAAGFTKRYILDATAKARTVAGWGTREQSYKDWGYLGAYENMEFYVETHFMNMRRLYNEARGIKTPGRRSARAVKY